MQSGKSPENSASSKKKTMNDQTESQKGVSKENTTKSSSIPRDVKGERSIKKAGSTSPSSKTPGATSAKTEEEHNRLSGGAMRRNSWSPASFVPAAYAERQSKMAPRYFFNTSIPQSYHQSYFRAMARDPEWIFAYWEINPDQIQKAKSSLGDDFESSKKIIRLIDVTVIQYDGTNSSSFTDVEVNDFATNWYLKVPQSDRSYLLEIGFLSPRGCFEVLIRSNVVQIPRAKPSTNTESEWNTVDTDELLRLSGLNRIQIGASESMVLQQLEKKAKYNSPLSMEQIGASENVLLQGASEQLSSDWFANR